MPVTFADDDVKLKTMTIYELFEKSFYANVHLQELGRRLEAIRTNRNELYQDEMYLEDFLDVLDEILEGETIVDGDI